MSDYSRWEEVGYWYDEGGCGPPTQADEDWYYSHVTLAQDRPPAVNRQPVPMDGQLTIEDYDPRDDNSMGVW